MSGFTSGVGGVFAWIKKRPLQNVKGVYIRGTILIIRHKYISYEKGLIASIHTYGIICL